MKEAAFPSCAPTTVFLLNFSLSNLAPACVLHIPPAHRLFDTFLSPLQLPTALAKPLQLFLSLLKLSIPSLRNSLYSR